MSTTNALLLVVTTLLLLKFFPGEAAVVGRVVLVGAIAYGCYWLVARFPSWRRKRSIERHQAAQDEKEFWRYQAKQEAIRHKFDPDGKWNESTTVPTGYRSELRELNLQHRDMLQRRNGWSVNDFLDSEI